ncbi:binding-protein-dependent transport systems inner membrane component [Acetohalobium arabaticum DSM 5501]|uniref:Binding-protein-dependent transport systems inner membrane component n=1 Tax=Acetohalobium arabaticum (strain ATCC 49924 / DSM 5501 / Z-7288) TaxID=574087 RepID=D9QVB1_ACEAZ|nr:binding-protein-dependent transport systems inner membrane component [Acetohalobium arabaticum DSM 5501]
MFNYIIKRLIFLIPVVIIVAIVAFLITHVIPGDPVRVMLGNFASEDQVMQLKSQLGMNKPLHLQFMQWITRIVKGDFGKSLFLNIPVTEAILSRIEPTFILAIIGEILGIGIGVPMGVIAAVNHKSWIDQLSITVSLAGVSIPSFWLSLMLILVFGVKLRWFPVCGYEPLAKAGLGSIKYLILPGVTLGFMQSGLIARMTRSAMLDVLKQDYIRTARNKGLAERVVIARHAMKNALIPVVTVIGLNLAVLLGGTWIVETVFNIPGTGSLAINAIMKRDLPVIQGCMIFIAILYVLMNLFVDISYAFINPKVRYKNKGGGA